MTTPDGFEFNQCQQAWLKKLSRFSNDRKAVQQINRLEINDPAKAECFDYVAAEWLCLDESRMERVKNRFDWIFELMFESPQFIKVQLDTFGHTLTEREVDEISICLLCRVGFLSPQFLDKARKRDEEFSQLMEVVKMLLTSNFCEPKSE